MYYHVNDKNFDLELTYLNGRTLSKLLTYLEKLDNDDKLGDIFSKEEIRCIKGLNYQLCKKLYL